MNAEAAFKAAKFGIVSTRAFSTMSPARRKSRSVRFVCMTDSPTAFARSAWVIGNAKLNPSTYPVNPRSSRYVKYIYEMMSKNI